ncbi:hypothetical protein Ancab_020743 [Ancistrocladus abbreviatus]
MIHSTPIPASDIVVKISLSSSIIMGATFPKLTFHSSNPRPLQAQAISSPSSNPSRARNQNPEEPLPSKSLAVNRNTRLLCDCSCGRRHFIRTIATTASLPPSLPSSAAAADDDGESSTDRMLTSTATLNEIHPQRPNWYEELYALVLNNCTKAYEAEIAEYKSQLFNKLRGSAKEVVELGIGTGPNLKYYAGDPGVRVLGFDPNKKMEKYARAAAEVAGLPQTNFKFMQAVGEALPISDASVDAVIGTLVLCSVKDVNRTLREVRRVLKPGGMYLFVEHVGAKEGTFRRYLQNFLNPLQQMVADGCHLTRDTGKCIAEAGFVHVDSSMAFLSKASLVNPHIYGVACK